MDKKEMFWVRFHVMTLTEKVIESSKDPTLWEAFQHVFQWANEVGLEGKRVRNLSRTMTYEDPLDVISHWTCEIELTKDEIEKQILRASEELRNRMENTNYKKEES